MSETLAPAAQVELVRPDKMKMILHAIWMAILLGIFMQLVALFLVRVPSVGAFVKDLTQKVTWSAIVCLGVTAGNAISRGKPSIGGLAGLLAAPLAFVVAKSTGKSVSTALSIGGGAEMPQKLFWALVCTKAVQYALFGMALIWIAKKSWGKFPAHLGLGSVAGIVFGGLIVYFTADLSNPTPKTAQLVALCTNEVLFPIGCAAVIYAANALARSDSRA